MSDAGLLALAEEKQAEEALQNLIELLPLQKGSLALLVKETGFPMFYEKAEVQY